jgi:DnaJ-class molecular chaperone
MIPCKACYGFGAIRCVSCTGKGMAEGLDHARHRCNVCRGSGLVQCEVCIGRGRVLEDQPIGSRGN